MGTGLRSSHQVFRTWENKVEVVKCGRFVKKSGMSVSCNPIRYGGSNDDIHCVCRLVTLSADDEWYARCKLGEN